MSVYGPIVPVTTIEDLITTSLRTWIESYLGELERTVDFDGSIAKPKSWGIPQGDFVKRPEQLTPAISVLSPGEEGTPSPDGDGYYAVAYQMEVRVVVSANTPAATNALVKAYATAVALCLVQQPLGSPVEDVVWLGNQYDDLTGDSDRSMLGATIKLNVYADRVMQRRVGPTAPEAPDPRDPTPDWPTVATVGLSADALPVAGD